MEAPLRSFCIACARYASGDRLGQALAVVAAAPYFVTYHVSVLVHARRELHMALLLPGLLLVSALSMVLKKALRQPRPAATCALLGNCHKHGMPSSHSAVMAFAATTCILLHIHRKRQHALQHQHRYNSGSTDISSCGGRVTSAIRQPKPAACSHPLQQPAPLAQALELLEVFGMLAVTAAVGYGRVYLGYHTAGQVAAGCALGATSAALWWQLTFVVCRRWGHNLLDWSLLRMLRFRDTLGCRDSPAVEAAAFAAAHGGTHID